MLSDYLIQLQTKRRDRNDDYIHAGGVRQRSPGAACKELLPSPPTGEFRDGVNNHLYPCVL